ncbi:OLC1v1020969C1 [Oldenlandia corymbosa var. corymbosa]|uniref:OLC1v1020969C1 n=1 Tax=Oldenlandia corymbosa var. corymbosa TaxID=529605 RepID=A0AAV1BUL9_OLDCO|nr:OLC1v1020969C1 [Oldenlandia corymbosa var. corymbosa]
MMQNLIKFFTGTIPTVFVIKQMQLDLVDTELVFKNMIELDVINARARYSMSFGGSFPDIYLPKPHDIGFNTAAPTLSKEAATASASHPTQRKWTLYLHKIYHPLLVQQHKQKLQKAKKAVSDANAEIRRRRLGGSVTDKKEADLYISNLEKQVIEIKQSAPVPTDVFVGQDTRVVVITGPNTGGKTICLKTVGLAGMMAKSGLYVLASEPIKIPWFDYVYADIGDEQSLSQSLSTFSGHLKQISEILSNSTNLSLVLLDEVGAGTNPLEGAALGMSVLEALAEGPMLTMATTHIGELKTLKYSNKAFENACMEFDETNLKPTFRILWGVPGRSNAINIAERLGIPRDILGNARELYGVASAEINEIIVEMERFKLNFHTQIQEAQQYLTLAKNLHRNLLLANKKIIEHRLNQRQLMAQEVLKVAADARSRLHSRVRQLRLSPKDGRLHNQAVKRSENTVTSGVQSSISGRSETTSTVTETSTTKNNIREPVSGKKRAVIPREGDKVVVRSLNREAVVLKVDASKEEVVVQAGNMKLKLKLVDIS